MKKRLAAKLIMWYFITCIFGHPTLTRSVSISNLKPFKHCFYDVLNCMALTVNPACSAPCMLCVWSVCCSDPSAEHALMCGQPCTAPPSLLLAPAQGRQRGPLQAFHLHLHPHLHFHQQTAQLHTATHFCKCCTRQHTLFSGLHSIRRVVHTYTLTHSHCCIAQFQYLTLLVHTLSCNTMICIHNHVSHLHVHTHWHT